MRGGPHIEMLATVSKGLGDLNKRAAFVGGASAALYITDQAAPPLRLTDDVDCVIEISSQMEYHKPEKELEKLGFKRPAIHEEGPVCRWKYSGIKVDVMPTHEKALGFKNQWYEKGLKDAVSHTLPGGQIIRVFSLPYLLASKIEAFLDRGKGDFLVSPDIEDIAALADGCLEFYESVVRAPDKVKAYLKKNFKSFLSSPKFLESLEGHIPEPGRASRAKDILLKL